MVIWLLTPKRDGFNSTMQKKYGYCEYKSLFPASMRKLKRLHKSGHVEFLLAQGWVTLNKSWLSA